MNQSEADKITESDFTVWKHHPVTLALVDTLGEEIKKLEEALLDPNLAMKEREKLIYIHGYREGLSQLASFRDSPFSLEGENEN